MSDKQKISLKGIGPFANHLIIGSVCFFLGMLFQNFPYDYYILWADPPTAATDPNARAPYFNINEEHLKFLHASPPLISRILHLVICVGLLGFVMKLVQPTRANYLFDGASLALYMCGITVYASNIVKGMRTATVGAYGDKQLSDDESMWQKAQEGTDGQYIGREDSLRVVAASNTILAFILVGILVLQAGQWYAQRAEAKEIEQINKERAEKKNAPQGKKKQ